MSDYDCGTNMCPVCDPSQNQSICTGVVGAAQTSQTSGIQITENTNQIWKYGNSTYVPNLRQLDQNPDCLNSTGLGITNAYGNCIEQTIGINNQRLTRKTNLVVGSSQDSTDNGSLDGSPTDIQALHKVWGDGNGMYNKGVNSKNVYIGSNPENINYKLSGNSYSKNQKVLYMEAHGDNYSGTVQD